MFHTNTVQLIVSKLTEIQVLIKQSPSFSFMNVKHDIYFDVRLQLTNSLKSLIIV